MEAVQFNIFKGLVLRKLAIYDGSKAIINLKEASCRFNILTLFIGKGIIISAVRLESPVIFLERRADNTLNLWDLLPKNTTPTQKTKLGVFVNRISITNARVDFQDNYILPHFTISIDDLSMRASLSFPASIKFNLKAKIPEPTVSKLDVDGEFILSEKKLIAKISISDLNPKEFSAYYQNSGFLINEGMIDAIATDHAPHTEVEKQQDFTNAPTGISGLETALGSLLGLVHTGEISIKILIAALTGNPAKIINRPELGTLKAGAPADITIFDPDREWVVDPKNFASKGKNTPLAGRTLKGKVMATIYGGNIVYRDTAFKLKPKASVR